MSGGGGGNAGAVSWPGDMQTAHLNLMGMFTDNPGTSPKDMDNLLKDSKNLTPFGDVPAYAANLEVSNIQESYESFKSLLDEKDPNVIWETYVNKVFSMYNQIPDIVHLHPEPTAVQDILDNWILVEPVLDEKEAIIISWIDLAGKLNAIENIPGGWMSVISYLFASDKISDMWEDIRDLLEADENISSNWTMPTFTAADDIKLDMAAATTIDAAVTAYGDRLDDQILGEVLPRFESGMSDINAVQSSAFVIGRAIIEGMRDRDVANFSGELAYKAYLQRDNLLGQTYMQEDKINADSLDGKNKMLSQAYLDLDKLVAASLDAKNKAIAQALMDADKLVANDIDTENKGMIQANLDTDKLLANDVDTENKSITQALLDRQKLQAESISEGNKLRSQAAIQVDKIMADDVNAENLVAAEMRKHETSLVVTTANGLLNSDLGYIDNYKAWAGYVIDAERLIYVMHKEEVDQSRINSASDARWPFTCWESAGNIMASISGGTTYQAPPTQAQNALGGAFAGAAIGARAVPNTPAIGAGAGAILGGIGAMLLGGN